MKDLYEHLLNFYSFKYRIESYSNRVSQVNDLMRLLEEEVEEYTEE